MRALTIFSVPQDLARGVRDSVLLALAVAALALLRSPGLEPERVLPWSLVFAVLTVVCAASLGVYRPLSLPAVLLRSVLVLPFSSAAFWLLPWPVPGVAALAWQVCGVVALLFAGARIGATAWPALNERRVLVAGAGPAALAVQGALASTGGVRLVGFHPLREDETIASVRPLLSGALSLVQTARALKATDIVVAVRERRGGGLPQQELLACRLAGIRVIDLASFFERQRGQVRVDALHPSWFIYGEGFRQDIRRRLVKRATDVLGALLLGLFASPLMILTAVAIMLESAGPVLYRQERVGQGGRVFSVIKFRSMHIDAEQDGTPRWARAGDSRITRVGRVIRRFRIDELPQLWCVLRGEMSLIGPRPERPFFVAQLAREVPFYALRHSVKPGLTGWAQVRYQYGESIADAIEKLQYDLYYLKHGGVWLDLKILLTTVKVVLTGQGAH